MIPTFNPITIKKQISAQRASDALLWQWSQGSSNKQKRGLIVQQPWLDMILSEEKTMDLRSFSTNIRGEVAILHDGKIWGYVNLYDVLGPMTKREIHEYYNQHRVDSHLVGNYE